MAYWQLKVFSDVYQQLARLLGGFFFLLMGLFVEQPITSAQSGATYLTLQHKQQRDYLNEGYNAAVSGQWEGAVQLWEAALAEADDNQDFQRKLYSLCYLSNGYVQLSQYDRALQMAESCLEQSVILENITQQLLVMPLLVQLYSITGDPETVINKYEWLLAQARSVQDRGLEIDVMLQIGDFYTARYEQAKATEIYQQALHQAEDLNDATRQAKALIRLGIAFYEMQQLDAAAAFQQRGLTIAQQNSDQNLQASALLNLANIQRDLGFFQDAIDLLEQSLAIRLNLQDSESEIGIIYGNLGNIFKDLGHYNVALRYINNSLDLAMQTDDPQRQIVVLNSLGGVYSDRGDAEQGDYGKAISYFEQSLQLARQMNNIRAQANALNNLGGAYHRQLRYETAKDYYLQGLILAQGIGNPRLVADAMSDLGFVHEGLVDYPTAIDYYRQGLEGYLELGLDRSVTRLLNNRAHTYLTWAKRIQTNGGNESTAKLELAKNDLIEATELLEQLWSQVSSDIDRVSLFDTQQMTYNLLQQILIAQDPVANAGQALMFSEQGRGQAFAKLLEEKLGHTLALPTPERMQAIAQERGVTLVEYSIMPRDEVIHQGKDTGKAGQIYIWVVQPDGDIHFAQVDLAGQDIDFEALVRASRGSIGARNRGLEIISVSEQRKNEQQLETLHNLLIAPVQQWLPTDPEEKIVFIPHRELFLVPFAALRDPDGKYFVESHTPVTAPSIQLLDLTHQQRQIIQQTRTENLEPLQGDNVLIVGNPEMPKYWNGQGWAQLSGLANAQIEAQAISRLFETDPLIGAEATEITISNRMESADLIHLATHGLLEYRNTNPEEPQAIPGAIALTPTPTLIGTRPTASSAVDPGDGLLTATEISSLNLKAELVVLSACDTGRGDLSGDGVLGLSRSLIAAGSPSIIVSLWSVPDAPTSQLMRTFYEQWQTQGQDKAQALRQAMLRTMETHSNPNAWAAFSLIGEFD